MSMTSAAFSDEFRQVRPERLRPFQALQAFRRLIRNKEDTTQVFEIMRALSGRSPAKGYQRLLSSVEGGRQAFLRNELAHRLDDGDWLARFGPETVGGTYRAFREARGFTADGLADIEREVVSFVDAPHPIVWYSRRIRDVHDIWHVLTGYGTDTLGEACLVGFSYGQTGNLGFGFIGLGAAQEIAREDPRVPARKAVFQAWRNARKARWLPALDYEALFDQPLEAVRARLNIRPPTVYDSVPIEIRQGLKLRG